MDGKKTGRPPHVLWLLVAAAMGLRLAAVAVVDGPDLVPASESGLTAANWVAGRGYSFDFYGYRSDSPLQSFMPPLFTAVVAACLLTPWPAAVFHVLQAVLSTLTVLLIYLVGERLAGRAVGLLAAGLTAVYPPFLVLVDQPTVPALNTFLLALWLWAVLCLAGETGRSRPTAWAALAGLALGLCALSRPSAVSLLAVTLVALWLAPGARVRQWAVPALVTAVVLGLTVAPWLARGLWVHGRPVWISTNGGFSFWNGNNPFTTGSAFDVRVDDLEAYAPGSISTADAGPIVQVKPYPLPLELRDSVATLDEVALDRALYRSAFGFIREQPGRWLGLLGQKLASLWWFRPNVGRSSGFYQEAWIGPYRLLYAAVLVTAGTGLLVSLKNWRRYVPLYGLFLTGSAVYVAYNAITRYRWEMEPFLLVLAALALVTAARQLAAWRPARACLGAWGGRR